MARIYTAPRVAGRFFASLERGFCKVVRVDPDREQDWKGYGLTVLVFSILFWIVLYVIQRAQGHLFLNPDHMQDVPSHLSLNTAASFITNTNWQFYGGEYTMSYLTQMAGLAVQNFVSAAVGIAVLSAVVRGLARRSSATIGNFWVDLYRTLVYLLLPLAVVVHGLPRLAGRAADVPRPRDRDDAPGRAADDRARPRRLADRDQAARDERRRLLQLELGGPVREPDRALELLRDARDPADPGGRGVHVRPDGLRAATRVGGVRRDVRCLRDRDRREPAGGAARLGGAAPLGRQPRDEQLAERREHGRQGDPLRTGRDRQLDGRDERRLERLGQRRVRRA